MSQTSLSGGFAEKTTYLKSCMIAASALVLSFPLFPLYVFISSPHASSPFQDARNPTNSTVPSVQNGLVAIVSEPCCSPALFSSPTKPILTHALEAPAFRYGAPFHCSLWQVARTCYAICSRFISSPRCTSSSRSVWYTSKLSPNSFLLRLSSYSNCLCSPLARLLASFS